MGKRVAFLTGSCGREIWMWKIYQEMARHEEIIPHFIATREKNVDYLKSQGVGSEQITVLLPFQKNGAANTEYLKGCEKRYAVNLWDLWSVSAVRKRSRRGLSTQEIMSYFHHAFRVIEDMVETKKPDYCISYGPSGYHAMALYAVLQQRNIPVVEMVASMIPNRFTFAKDLSNTWPLLLHSYIEIKKKGLHPEEKEKAERFILDFRNRPVVQDCAREFREPISKKVKRFSSQAYQLLKYRKLPPDIRFVFWPLIQKAYDYSGVFEKAVPGEKYALFPLHYQPESTTLIHGKWYVDQLSLIENIAKSTPITHKLYVKEHPFGYGNRNPSFYRRLRKIPNIRIISPHENNFELIKRSSLLLTITGTAGWEALLFGIPAVTFGNIFYNTYEGTIKIDDILTLPKIIRKNLDKKIELNKVVPFVAAMLQSSYPGLARLPSDCNDYSLEEGNIRLLVEGIRDYISTMEQKQNGIITNRNE